MPKNEKQFKNFEKYTPKDVKFFNDLVDELSKKSEYKEYKFSQSTEHIIINTGSKEIHIPKWDSIPLKNKPGGINIKDYIKEILAERQNGE